MKVFDLVKKHGWLALASLHGLGIFPNSNNHVFFVDQNSPNALDADDGVHGQTWETPYNTIGYAITRNNATIDWSPDQGEWWGLNNYILVAPGKYEEELTSAPHSCTVIGMGSCQGLPSTEGAVMIAPSSGTPLAVSTHIACTWQNIHFEGQDSSGKVVDIGICNNSAFMKCRFHTNVADMGKFIELDDATRLVIKDCIFSSGTTDGGYGIYAGANSGTTLFGCVFENNIINASTAGIYVTSSVTLSGGTWIKGNDIANPAKGIDLDNTSNNLIRISDNRIIASSDAIEGATAALVIGNSINEAGVGDWEVETLVGKNSADNAVDTSSVASNRDGSVLERQEEIADDTDAIIEDLAAAVPAVPVAKSLQDMLNKDRAGSNTYDSSTDSLEAIRDRVDTLNTADQVDLDAILLDTGTTLPAEHGTIIAGIDDLQGIERMAGIYYVDASISSSGDGSSWTTAFKTLSEAIAVATTRNDKIYIAPGDYDEGDTVAITTNGLQIIGPGPDTQNKAMLWDDATGYDLMTINAHEVVIDGLAFSSALDTYNAIVISNVSDSFKVTIRNCRFDGWDGEYGIYTDDTQDSPDLLIENNLFRSWNTAAVRVNATRSCVRNNIFHVVTDKIGLEHVPSGSSRPDNVYMDNIFSGVSNSSTTGIKFTGAPDNGTCMCGRNLFFGTWNTTITKVAAYIGVHNYVSDDAGGDTLVDTVT